MQKKADIENSYSKSDFQQSILYHVRYSTGNDWDNVSVDDLYKAAALSIREYLIDGMLSTSKRYNDQNDIKTLYYFSMEFLMGRSLGNNLMNLGIFDLAREALEDMGVDLEEIRDREKDAALGNGGLGRLAACFLDSLATLGMPGYGYGINYQFGLFKQEIDNGFQKEKPDQWYNENSPWLISKPEDACIIPVYGKIDHFEDMDGNYNPMWMDWKILIGIPYDFPVIGFGGKTVNFLRLFSAKSSDEFDMSIFNDGDYFKAVEQKIASETISKVLYPSDSIAQGKELRLIQEYFLVACSIRDITRKYLSQNDSFDNFHKKVAIQLNDTHPSLSVAELMRTFIDEYDLEWEKAWRITEKTLGYTNHTLLPEALEKWPVPLMEHVLPRHLQIIYEINNRFINYAKNILPNHPDAIRNMSIIEESNPKQVRMANLSIIGSHSVNGVAEIHSGLVKERLFPDFHQLWPEKFNNKTNGVTQRRWVLKSNPLLSKLLHEVIGDGWITDMSQLSKLEKYMSDSGFLANILQTKKENKERLAKVIFESTRMRVDSDTLFDVQVKRIHEYKRQLLNVMQIIHQYLTIIEDKKDLVVPKTYIFAGKAAPGYKMAKLIIKLINSVANVVNKDPLVKDQMKVVMIPDYKVSLAETIIPAADLSEQISTAGMEASGTGNMKLSMNGALTIGTLDGANIEILEEVGAENIYIFGHTVQELQKMKQDQSYNPREFYDNHFHIKRVMDIMGSNALCSDISGLFQPIYNKILREGDYYFHLADFQPYIDAQEQVSLDYHQPEKWAEKVVVNIARMGKFSSDRTIQEYAHDIWGIKPCL